MPSRWNGKINKLNPWSTKGESKKTSFVPPKSEEPDIDGFDFKEGKSSIPDTDNTITGTTRQFNPQEEYNFKSAYKRYLKALDLAPSKIKTEGNKITYLYYSSDSNTGFWEVTIEEDNNGTFINLLIPSFVVLCPPVDGFKLTGAIESDGTVFKWEQKAGNKTVLFNNNTVAEPVIFIQSSCYTSGCSNGTESPIVLRVSLEGNSSIFQDLIIFNNLVSSHFGISTTKAILSDRECQKVSIIFYTSPPAHLQKAYCENQNSVFVTWNPPSCESEFIIGYSLTINTTGSYVVVDYAGVNEERLFELQLNKHYRIISHFNFYGKLVNTPSDTFYFTSTNIPHITYSDDNFIGISSAKENQNITTIDLKVSTYQYQDVYYNISSSKQTQAINKIDLKFSSYSYLDEQIGISANKQYSSYTKVNLGGIVIG